MTTAAEAAATIGTWLSDGNRKSLKSRGNRRAGIIPARFFVAACVAANVRFYNSNNNSNKRPRRAFSPPPTTSFWVQQVCPNGVRVRGARSCACVRVRTCISLEYYTTACRRRTLRAPRSPTAAGTDDAAWPLPPLLTRHTRSLVVACVYHGFDAYFSVFFFFSHSFLYPNPTRSVEIPQSASVCSCVRTTNVFVRVCLFMCVCVCMFCVCAFARNKFVFVLPYFSIILFYYYLDSASVFRSVSPFVFISVRYFSTRVRSVSLS